MCPEPEMHPKTSPPTNLSAGSFHKVIPLTESTIRVLKENV